MDSTLYKEATQGNVQSLKQRIQQDRGILNSATPQENTALHLAARHGHRLFAQEILKACNTLLITRNIDEDTPLHIAARAGHLEIVALLIDKTYWPTDIESGQVGPLRMTNRLRNTPLHEAVKNYYSEIARKLLDAEPSERWSCNEQQERDSIAYCCEGGVEGCGFRDLAAPLGRGARVGGATIGWNWIPTPPSCARWSFWNYEGRSSLHVAAAYNASAAIKEILRLCPDAAEQLDDAGQNVLHIAVISRTIKALKCLLKNIRPEEIINQADHRGNTPLHLAAKNSRIHSTILLLEDKRVDPCILNDKGQTARRIIESLEYVDTYEMHLWQSLKKSEERKCKKQHQLSEPEMISSFEKKPSTATSTAEEHFKASVGTYALVSALIATVTFAAIFTMPGGYSQDHGYALLAKHAAFKIFVISDTIAMCSSLIVVFCFIWAWKDPLRFKVKQLMWGHRLTVIASLAMLVALMTAVYVVLESQCKWVAIVVCVICCSAPFILWAILGHDIVFIPV